MRKFEHLTLERREKVLTLKLSREDVLNAFNLKLIAELVESLRKADEDPEVHVVIITGAGRAFSAGGDIKAMHDKTDMFAGDEEKLRVLYEQGIQQIPLTLSKMEKPVIAMVNGPAVGAGCDLACMCDLRILSEKAFFQESFINLSLVSGDGGSYFLSRLIGYGKTMDMLLTGRRVLAKESLEIGLANYVFTENELERNAWEIAKSLSSKPLTALRFNKKLLKNAVSSDLEGHLKLAAQLQAHIQRGQEHETLVKEFFQKS